MGMREDFDAFWRRHCDECGRDPNGEFVKSRRRGALASWQHLYPEVERLRSESAELQRQLIAIRAGHTKTVEYDLSPAMQASAVRDKLIELGWTPPSKAELEADNDQD